MLVNETHDLGISDMFVKLVIIDLDPESCEFVGTMLLGRWSLFQKASRASCCVHHATVMRCAPLAVSIPKFPLHQESLKEIGPELKHVFVKFCLETGRWQIHRDWTKAQRDSSTLVECQNLVRCYDGCRSERHGTFACWSLFSLSNNCVWECFFECCLPVHRALDIGSIRLLIRDRIRTHLTKQLQSSVLCG